MSAESAVGSGALSVEGIGGGGAPPLLRDHTARGFLARITAHGTANAYGFARVDEGLPATVPELEGDAAISGDGEALAAYEIGGSTSVPTDGSVIAWLEPLRGGVGYHFAYGAAAAAISSGEALLAANYTITTDGTWEDTGLALSLPSAGLYLLGAQVSASLVATWGGGGRAAYIFARLAVGSTAVGPVICCAQSGATGEEATGTGSLSYPRTAASAESVKVQAYRVGTGFETFTSSYVSGGVGTNSVQSALSYLKLS